MTWEVQEMPLEGPLFDQAISVYGEAFMRPPYRDPGRGREVRDRIITVHRFRPGYAGRIAVEAGAVVGMAYVHTSMPGQWWHDTVASTLGPGLAERWLSSALELVEIAVTPDAQGRGIGSCLIDSLITDRGERSCVLSTRSDSRAHELYGRLGFEVIGEMTFAPGGAPFLIMVRCLDGSWER